jgi:hypothetical protein
MRQGVHHVGQQQVLTAGFDRFGDHFQKRRLHVLTRHVLRLEGTASPAPGARRAVELQRAAHAVVVTQATQQGSVLGRAGRAGRQT